MDEKIEKWTLRFPAKENPNKQKELFDWPIVLQYDVKAKYRLISRKFSGVLGVKFFHLSVRLTNQKPREFVSGSINQSNRSIYVRLLFLFCSRIFISRSYENRSNIHIFVVVLHINTHIYSNSPPTMYLEILKKKFWSKIFLNKVHPNNSLTLHSTHSNLNHSCGT